MCVCVGYWPGANCYVHASFVLYTMNIMLKIRCHSVLYFVTFLDLKWLSLVLESNCAFIQKSLRKSQMQKRLTGLGLVHQITLSQLQYPTLFCVCACDYFRFISAGLRFTTVLVSTTTILTVSTRYVYCCKFVL